MEYTRLGSSGLKVSRIALGCMSFGDPAPNRSWTLDVAALDFQLADDEIAALEEHYTPRESTYFN